MMNAQLEGDEIPPDPIRVFMYGDGFASIDGELQMSAFGPSALRTIAQKLLVLGYDADQQLDVHRGGERLNRMRLRAAAHQEGDDF